MSPIIFSYIKMAMHQGVAILNIVTVCVTAHLYPNGILYNFIGDFV
jgi:hypothetical protein